MIPVVNLLPWALVTFFVAWLFFGLGETSPPRSLRTVLLGIPIGLGLALYALFVAEQGAVPKPTLGMGLGVLLHSIVTLWRRSRASEPEESSG